MTELAVPEVREPGLSLDKRQRAMLKEMGIQVWQPLPVSPVTDVTPVAKTVVAPVSPAALPIPASPTATINSGAAYAHSTGATGTFSTQKQAKQAIETAKNPPEAESGLAGGWRIGKPQTLYPESKPATAARWLILIELPASALADTFHPFEGDAGQLLDNMLRAAKLHTAASATLAPLVRGQAAGSNLSADIASIFASAKADVVVVMGRLAAQALLQSTEPLAKLRGQRHSVHGQPTIVCIDPNYLLRNPLDKPKAWDDLCLAINVVSSGVGQRSTP